MDDDSLGDLADVMGEDYGHGYNDDDGDPNVKPRSPPPPTVRNAKSVTQTSIEVVYPKQKQFLNKLVIQCMPLDSVPKDGLADPFAAFATTAAIGGKICQPEDPTECQKALFENLIPGHEYLFRLVVTNPAGTSRGKASKPFVTLPATPEAPEFAYASAKSVSIKFPAAGHKITKLGIEMAVWCADPFGPNNKKKGLLTDTSKNIGVRTTGLVRNLHPGKPYVFRIAVTNRAGTSIGAPSKPIKTLPRVPNPPREDTALRTDTTVGLKFGAHGEGITKLTMQYAQLAGKTTFDDLKKNGGREVTLSNPQETTAHLVKNLVPDKNYVFRLIAHNTSGKSTGAIMGPIKTVTFTPELLDKSGWLVDVSSKDKKTLARRLSSLKKATGNKFFYTIDGKLLSWAAEPKGEEIGFLHLGKVGEVVLQGNAVELTLKKGGKGAAKTLTLLGNSDDPNVTSEKMMSDWKDALVEAITGNKAVNEELKAASSAGVKAAPVDLDALEDEEEEGGGFGDGADEEEEGGFGDGDEEEGGFGMSDDESEGEDGDFGGGFGEDDEDDEVGFGGADEDD